MPEPENLKNLFSLYRLAGGVGEHVELLQFEGYSVIRARQSAWPNMAFDVDSHLTGRELADGIADKMKALNARPTVILQDSHVQPGVMRQAGFFPVDQWVGMSYDGIKARKPGETAGSGDGFIVDGSKDILSWTNVVSETLFNRNSLDERIFRSLCSGGVELIGVKTGDELAGTSMVYIDEDGVAGIYMVGIKEKFRGKGLGKRLVGACMKSIADKGIDKCYLQSTRMGLGLYKGLSFKETDKYLIFCKIK